MPGVQTLAGLLTLSVVSGINLYATVLVLGLSIRYGWLQGIPPELHILAHPIVLVAAGLMYLIEFFADKVPFVTPIWDAIHTFIRPLGAAALAFGIADVWGPMGQTLAALAGGSLALGAHSTKMGVRLLAHASPEPASHSVLSLIEDFGVVGLVILAYQYPWIALGVVLALIVLMALLAPLVWRTLRFMLRGFAGRVVSWMPAGGRRGDGVPCPPWLDLRLRELIPQRGERIYPCFTRSLRQAPRVAPGYLVWAGERLFFAYRRFFRSRVLPLGQPVALHTGAVFDVLAVRNQENKVDSLYLTKDWSRELPALRVDPGYQALASR